MMNGRAWEPEEDDMLKLFYGEVGPDGLSDVLNRTPTAVMVRASVLRDRGRAIPHAPGKPARRPGAMYRGAPLKERRA